MQYIDVVILAWIDPQFPSDLSPWHTGIILWYCTAALLEKIHYNIPALPLFGFIFFQFFLHYEKKILLLYFPFDS